MNPILYRLRVLSIAVAALTFGLGCKSSSNDCPAGWTNGIAPLHTDGRFFKDPAGNVVVLRGVDIIDPVDLDDFGGTMNTDRLLSLLTDAGQGFYVRAVRITVFPGIYKKYGADTYLRQYLEPAVKQATALGLYVIVDWHEIADAEAVADETMAFWQFMAPKFAGYSNVLYEVFNEPTNFSDTSWAHWKQYAQPWVDEIRRSAPDRIILIGGPYYSQLIGGAASDPFVGSNLAYVAHIYAEDVGPRRLLDETGPIAQAASTHPVFITEWGFAGNATQTSFGQPVKAFIESHGLSWTAWCADGIWSQMMFDKQWNLLVGEDKMGGFAKEWLAERKDQDQPEKAKPGQCPAMVPTHRPPASERDGSADDALPDTVPDTTPAVRDASVIDGRICQGTPNEIGSEACPTTPFEAYDTLCHDVGRTCSYHDCGDLVSCECQDYAGTGNPIWTCAITLW